MIARTSDGETLQYDVVGPASGTPILTTRGLVSSDQHWRFFTPHFSVDHPVLSWDYRGHGAQQTPTNRAVSVAQFADDAYEVWRASGLPPAIVVGLSFGVQVALEIWRRHPEMVRAFVLICGTPGHPLDRVSPSPRLRRAVIGMVQAFGRQPVLARPILGFFRTPIGVRIAREITYASGGAHREACPPEVLEGLFQHAGALDPELFGNVVGAYFDHDAEAVLPTITVPTLIIAGDRDQLTPVATAERMQRAIPNSELVVFPGHSHLVQVEKPEEVHAAIEDFLHDRGL